MALAIKQKPNKLTRIDQHRGYRFKDRDPDMEWICEKIDKLGLSVGDVIEAVLDVTNNQTSISYSCIACWLNGKTRRPSNRYLTLVGKAIGFDREWVER